MAKNEKTTAEFLLSPDDVTAVMFSLRGTEHAECAEYVDGKLLVPSEAKSIINDAIKALPELHLNAASSSLRVTRNRLLQESDWTQLGDVPDATKEKWKSYRQALRDLPASGSPLAVEWPVPPDA